MYDITTIIETFFYQNEVDHEAKLYEKFNKIF